MTVPLHTKLTIDDCAIYMTRRYGSHAARLCRQRQARAGTEATASYWRQVEQIVHLANCQPTTVSKEPCVC